MEADEEEEECLERYKVTGSKRVFVLAEVQGVPENRTNYEIIIKSLNLASLGDDIQIVCDLKLVNILLGIQTATAMHGCPYCESYKVNLEQKKTNNRGKYQKVDGNDIVMRTWSNIELHSENYKLYGGGNRKKLMEHKNVEHKAIQLKTVTNVNEEVILTLPPEPLHTNLLGPVNDVMEVLEKLHPDEIHKFYKKTWS